LGKFATTTNSLTMLVALWNVWCLVPFNNFPSTRENRTCNGTKENQTVFIVDTPEKSIETK
jgi:hypothetical protein